MSKKGHNKNSGINQKIMNKKWVNNKKTMNKN